MTTTSAVALERAPLSIFQACMGVGVKASGRDERLMHERDDREPRGLARDYFRHCAKRETVHKCDCFVGKVRTARAAYCRAAAVGRGKLASSWIVFTTPTLPPQKSFRDASVVDVTAGARVERTGCDERDCGHSYDALSTLASKDADATCDSWSVTPDLFECGRSRPELTASQSTQRGDRKRAGRASR